MHHKRKPTCVNALWGSNPGPLGSKSVLTAKPPWSPSSICTLHYISMHESVGGCFDIFFTLKRWFVCVEV